MEEDENLSHWIVRTILDNSEGSISIVCNSEEQTAEIHAFLLLQGFRSLLLHSKERKYFVDKHIRLLKRRLYDVVVSTEIQKSADLQIVLSSASVPPQQKAIFVHSSNQQAHQTSDEEISDGTHEVETVELPSSDIQDEKDIDIQDVDKNTDETNTSTTKPISYHPPEMEEARRKKEESVLFRLIKKRVQTTVFCIKILLKRFWNIHNLFR